MEKINKKLNIPTHIGITMEGNRRWAKERNLPNIEGYVKAYELIKKSPEWFFSLGVEELSFYFFSCEDWKRNQEEVNFIMKLLKKGVDEEFGEIGERGYRIVFSGRIDELPGDLPDSCRALETKTKMRGKGTINICVNYGGRQEITDAFKNMMAAEIDLSQIHEGMIKKYLYQSNFSDLDLLIRTGGENNLSNFLLWQSVDAKLVSLKKFWPEFEKRDAELLIEKFLAEEDNNKNIIKNDN